MKPKTTYRVRNWSQYNKSLVSRGNIHIWISKEVASKWRYEGIRKAGGVKKYSDLAIKACLLIREVYRLTLRTCEGFMNSLSTLLGIECVPHYSTLCRRADTIQFDLVSQLSKKKHLHILIDSTGLKVRGLGEWSSNKQGLKKHALWIKLHAAVDHATQKFVAIKRSSAHGYDSRYLVDLLEDTDLDIECLYGDGAYDKRICYQKAHELGAHLLAPVQRYARKQQANRNYPDQVYMRDRDRKIDFLAEFESHEVGTALWKRVSGYHKRSLVETAFYRLQQCFGKRIQNRKAKNQWIQMMARAYALNKMTDLGMPESIKI